MGGNGTLTEKLLDNKITLDDAILQGGYLKDCNTGKTYYASDFLEKYVYPDAKDLSKKLNDYCRREDLKDLGDLLKSCVDNIGGNLSIVFFPFFHSQLKDEMFSFLFEKKNVLFPLIYTPNGIDKWYQYYFQDTGVVCHLLDIKDVQQLRVSKHYSLIFKNFIINEVIKLLRKYNKDLPIGTIFGEGKRIGEKNRITDFIIYKEGHKLLINIIPSDDFYYEMSDDLKYFGDENDERILVYQGTKVEEFDGIKVMPVKDFLNYCYESFS